MARSRTRAVAVVCAAAALLAPAAAEGEVELTQRVSSVGVAGSHTQGNKDKSFTDLGPWTAAVTQSGACNNEPQNFSLSSRTEQTSSVAFAPDDAQVSALGSITGSASGTCGGTEAYASGSFITSVIFEVTDVPVPYRVTGRFGACAGSCRYGALQEQATGGRLEFEFSKEGAFSKRGQLSPGRYRLTFNNTDVGTLLDYTSRFVFMLGPPVRCEGQVVTFAGAPGDDVFRGGPGPDVVNGRGGDDVVAGDPGNDRLCGSEGNDTLRGEGGRDRLFGAGGRDALDGHGQNDELFGFAGRDVIRGGPGDDVLSGGPGGNDRCIGGPGEDTGDASCEVGQSIELLVPEPLVP